MSDRIWTPPLTPPTRAHPYKDAISETFLIYLTLVSTLFSPYTLLTYSIFDSFFRTLGLRHLVVVNSDHCVTGIITRKDLIESRLEQIWHQEVCMCVGYKQ